MARFVYVVRFHENNNNHSNVKTFKTTARSSKDAAKHLKKKGQIVSVRKVKKVL